MCTEYAENGLQVGLHRARHVFDKKSSWQPCTGARPAMADARPSSMPRAASRPTPPTEHPSSPVPRSLTALSLGPLSRPLSRLRADAAMAGSRQSVRAAAPSSCRYHQPSYGQAQYMACSVPTSHRRSRLCLPNPPPLPPFFHYRRSWWLGAAVVRGPAISGYLHPSCAPPWVRTGPIVP